MPISCFSFEKLCLVHCGANFKGAAAKSNEANLGFNRLAGSDNREFALKHARPRETLVEVKSDVVRQIS
jgi:hypothetical protein